MRESRGRRERKRRETNLLEGSKKLKLEKELKRNRGKERDKNMRKE